MPGTYQWTDEEIEILKTLNEKGYTIPEMLKVFKARSEASLRAQVKRLGLKLNRPKPNLDLDLYKKMMEVEEV